MSGKKLALAAGGSLAAICAYRNGGLRRVLSAGVAAELFRRALLANSGLRAIAAQSAIIVAGDVRSLYAMWRDSDILPKFIPHLKAIHRLDETTSSWELAFRDQSNLQPTARADVDRPGECIRWFGSYANIQGSAQVSFSKFNDRDDATAIRLNLSVESSVPLPHAITEFLLKRQANQTLRNFKQLVETGEVATTRGQPNGSRTAITTLAQGSLAPILFPESSAAARATT